MRVWGFVAAALLSAVLLVPGGARAQPPRCILGGRYPVTMVRSYETHEVYGYTGSRELRGAEIYLSAEPGLTGEWLQRELDSEVSTGQCDFGVSNLNVKIDVEPYGGSFAVLVSGPDEAAASEILSRAQQMAR
jgi:hypothetical protein